MISRQRCLLGALIAIQIFATVVTILNCSDYFAFMYSDGFNGTQEEKFHISLHTSDGASGAAGTCRRLYETITILLWTPFYYHEDFEVGLGDAVYIRTKCPYTCYHTTDKAKWNDSAAIVFFLRSPYWPLPPGRREEQKWVYYMDESPVYRLNDDARVNRLFNWTMTYHRQSDILLPYGSYRRADVPNLYSIQPRSKPVVWLVSNCDTASKREQLFDELSKHINTTKFGACTYLWCTKSMLECHREYANEYYFYLAWENSLCDDYITEKVWDALDVGLVPVVYGGANYTDLLPPNSFIDVMQFASMKELAGRLHYLMDNLTAYAEYFRWKDNFIVDADAHKPAWCQLCEKLHCEQEMPTHSTFDVFDFWSVEKSCRRRTGESGRLLRSVNTQI